MKKIKMSEEQFKAELVRSRCEGWLRGYTDALSDSLKSTRQLSENLTARLLEVAVTEEAEKQ